MFHNTYFDVHSFIYNYLYLFVYREKWGGLLALLERKTGVFLVERIPKNDLVSLVMNPLSPLQNISRYPTVPSATASVNTTAISFQQQQLAGSGSGVFNNDHDEYTQNMPLYGGSHLDFISSTATAAGVAVSDEYAPMTSASGMLPPSHPQQQQQAIQGQGRGPYIHQPGPILHQPTAYNNNNNNNNNNNLLTVGGGVYSRGHTPGIDMNTMNSAMNMNTSGVPISVVGGVYSRGHTPGLDTMNMNVPVAHHNYEPRMMNQPLPQPLPYTSSSSSTPPLSIEDNFDQMVARLKYVNNQSAIPETHPAVAATYGLSSVSRSDSPQIISNTNLSALHTASASNNMNLNTASPNSIYLSTANSASTSSKDINSASHINNPSRCLHIGNVPANLNENQLLDEFEQFGEVETLKVVTQRNRRFAFVTYKTLEQSIVAKQRMSKIQSWKSAISFAHKESYATSGYISKTPSPALHFRSPNATPPLMNEQYYSYLPGSQPSAAGTGSTGISPRDFYYVAPDTSATAGSGPGSGGKSNSNSTTPVPVYQPQPQIPHASRANYQLPYSYPSPPDQYSDHHNNSNNHHHNHPLLAGSSDDIDIATAEKFLYGDDQTMSSASPSIANMNTLSRRGSSAAPSRHYSFNTNNTYNEEDEEEDEDDNNNDEEDNNNMLQPPSSYQEEQEQEQEQNIKLSSDIQQSQSVVTNTSTNTTSHHSTNESSSQQVQVDANNEQASETIHTTPTTSTISTTTSSSVDDENNVTNMLNQLTINNNNNGTSTRGDLSPHSPVSNGNHAHSHIDSHSLDDMYKNDDNDENTTHNELSTAAILSSDHFSHYSINNNNNNNNNNNSPNEDYAGDIDRSISIDTNTNNRLNLTSSNHSHIMSSTSMTSLDRLIGSINDPHHPVFHTEDVEPRSHTVTTGYTPYNASFSDPLSTVGGTGGGMNSQGSSSDIMSHNQNPVGHMAMNNHHHSSTVTITTSKSYPSMSSSASVASTGGGSETNSAVDQNEYQNVFMARLRQQQQQISSFPSPRSSPSLNSLVGAGGGTGTMSTSSSAAGLLNNLKQANEQKNMAFKDIVMKRLCDDTYVPTQAWPIDLQMDAPYCSAVVNQLRQFGCQTTISKLRGFLRNRLQAPDNIKSVPLKALLNAYPTLFMMNGNHVTLLQGAGGGGASGTGMGTSSGSSTLNSPLSPTDLSHSSGISRSSSNNSMMNYMSSNSTATGTTGISSRHQSYTNFSNILGGSSGGGGGGNMSNMSSKSLNTNATNNNFSRHTSRDHFATFEEMYGSSGSGNNNNNNNNNNGGGSSGVFNSNSNSSSLYEQQQQQQSSYGMSHNRSDSTNNSEGEFNFEVSAVEYDLGVDMMNRNNNRNNNSKFSPQMYPTNNTNMNMNATSNYHQLHSPLNDDYSASMLSPQLQHALAQSQQNLNNNSNAGSRLGGSSLSGGLGAGLVGNSFGPGPGLGFNNSSGIETADPLPPPPGMFSTILSRAISRQSDVSGVSDKDELQLQSTGYDNNSSTSGAGYSQF